MTRDPRDRPSRPRAGATGALMDDITADLVGNNPDEFRTMIESERESWGTLIRAINLRLD